MIGYNYRKITHI